MRVKDAGSNSREWNGVWRAGNEARVRVDKTFSKDEGERVDGVGPFITRWDQVERKGREEGWMARANQAKQ